MIRPSRPVLPVRPRQFASAIPGLAGVIAAAAFALAGLAFAVSARATGLVSETPSEPADIQQLDEPDVTAVVSSPLPVLVPELPVVPPRAAQGPMIALVIDDAGPDRIETSRALVLPVPLTVAILPYASDAPELDRRARALGHETFIHLPLEPEGLADPGPHAITRHQSPTDQQARVRWAMSRIPGATGLNNHMGSALTANGDAMRNILQPAFAADLIFLDSLTAPRSQAHRVARDLGMTALRRDVFLDHDANPDAIRRQIALLEALAAEQGFVIAIGHPRPLTLDALEDWAPEAARRGFRFVTLSELAAWQAGSDELVSVVGGAE